MSPGLSDSSTVTGRSPREEGEVWGQRQIKRCWDESNSRQRERGRSSVLKCVKRIPLLYHKVDIADWILDFFQQLKSIRLQR